jgi:hypothetical protein
MLISELVAQLEAIWSEHGDLIVMHEEEGEPYLVEQLEIDLGEPIARDDPWRDPPHVRITGPQHIDSDGHGGLRKGGTS